MGRQSELMDKNHDQGDKEYKFVLSNSYSGALTLRFIPDGWKDQVTYERNKTYQGVLRSYSTNELVFVKDGRDFIKNAYEAEGITSIINVTIYRLNFTTEDYTAIYAGILDMSTYKVDELGVTIQLIDNSFTEKFKSRDDVEVDLLDLETIDGSTLTPFTYEATDNLVLPTLIINRYGYCEYLVSGGYTTSNLQAYNYVYVTVPVSDIKGQFVEISTIDGSFNADLDTSNYQYFCSFQRSIQDSEFRTINVNGGFSLTTLTTESTTFKALLCTLDETNEIIDEIQLTSFNGANSVQVSFDEDIIVQEGYSIAVVVVKDFTNSSPVTIQIEGVDYDYFEHVTSLFTKNVIAFPVYEALLRCSQKITDKEDCLRTEFFGRTDSPLHAYSADGELANLTKGIYLRGADTEDFSYFPIKFKDLFKSLAALYNIGLSIDSVNQRIKIEALRDMFDNNVILDISDRITESQIKKEVIPELYYNKITAGYKSFEYETISGITEVNTKNVYSTVLNNLKNAKSDESILRADTQGIIQLLSNNFSNANTESIDGDDDIFFFDTERDHTDFAALQDDNFDTVDSDYEDMDKSFNLRFTPARLVYIHGAEIRAGLDKNGVKANTYLKFQQSEKNTDLTTKLTLLGSPTIVESDDIYVGTLDNPYYIPEKYVIEAPFYITDYAKIEANPNGIVKLSDTKYGWIWKLQTNNADNKAEFELLVVNLDEVTPI